MRRLIRASSDRGRLTKRSRAGGNAVSTNWNIWFKHCTRDPEERIGFKRDAVIRPVERAEWFDLDVALYCA